MVNVPGRSKGCTTCRRRKKGCDLRKPTCQRCETEGFKCAGYQRTTLWVAYEPKRTGSPSKPSFESMKECNQIRNTQSNDLSENQELGVPVQFFSKSLTQGQVELLVLDQFIELYLPETKAPSMIITKAPHWSKRWRDTVASMSRADPLLKQIVAALGLCCSGQRYADDAMSRQGVKLYGFVLSQLNGILHDSKRAAFNANVLASVLLMGLYEQFNGFSSLTTRYQSLNWQAHALGMKRLLEIQGPHAFAEERAFMVFQAVENSQFASAFASRKRTSLASTEWRTIPWTNRPKEPRDQFLDIAFHLPGLAEDADHALLAKSESDVTRLVEDFYQMLSDLSHWKSSLDGQLHRALECLSWAISTNPELVDVSKLNVSDLQTALLFCAVNIHIIILIHKLISVLPEASSMAFRAVLPDTLPYAHWIIRAVPTCLREGGIIGSQSALFPIGSIRWCILDLADDRPNDSALLEQLLGDLKKEIGYTPYMESFLTNISVIRTNASATLRVPNRMGN